MKKSVQLLMLFMPARGTLHATWYLSNICAPESGLIVFRGIAEYLKAEKIPGSDRFGESNYHLCRIRPNIRTARRARHPMRPLSISLGPTGGAKGRASCFEVLCPSCSRAVCISSGSMSPLPSSSNISNTSRISSICVGVGGWGSRGRIPRRYPERRGWYPYPVLLY